MGTQTVTIREIHQRDLANGFIDVLKDLTRVGDLSSEKAQRVFDAIKRNSLHKIFVAVSDSGEVLGTTTLLVEPKFIHDGRSVGHIEDVVVRKNQQMTGIGKLLVKHALDVARGLDCYKCILDCNRNVEGFYGKLGFKEHGIEMRIDF